MGKTVRNVVKKEVQIQKKCIGPQMGMFYDFFTFIFHRIQKSNYTANDIIPINPQRMRYVFIELLSVLRSQMKIVRKSNVRLREFSVAIEQNFEAICMDWLNLHAPSRDNHDKGSSAQKIQRRASVASCRNICSR